MIDKKLEPINRLLEKLDARLDKIEDIINDIKIDTQVTSADSNIILLWIEKQDKVQKQNPIAYKCK